MSQTALFGDSVRKVIFSSFDLPGLECSVVKTASARAGAASSTAARFAPLSALQPRPAPRLSSEITRGRAPRRGPDGSHGTGRDAIGELDRLRAVCTWPVGNTAWTTSSVRSRVADVDRGAATLGLRARGRPATLNQRDGRRLERSSGAQVMWALHAARRLGVERLLVRHRRWIAAGHRRRARCRREPHSRQSGSRWCRCRRWTRRKRRDEASRRG